jgi:hypothetical protein
LPELDLADGPLGDYGYDHIFSTDTALGSDAKGASSGPASVSQSDNSQVRKNLLCLARQLTSADQVTSSPRPELIQDHTATRHLLGGLRAAAVHHIR